ncbi:ataxin-7 isoform X1 [Monodelphis domestica]|uniref:Ataxin 7 n=1 Tax=Monodelphis domestica TaxID=13616 RepID=A0A5F8G5J8_MONDO|nr:ataxin-7 isoform X1 [Monodelphis domestica]
MSERAADDVRGEPRRAAAAAAAGGAAAAAARQQHQHQHHQQQQPPQQRPPQQLPQPQQSQQQQQQQPPPRLQLGGESGGGGGGGGGASGGGGGASTSAATMATVGERRSLPSPEAMVGQPWNHWVEAAKLPGKEGSELEESLKEFGKNREVMRLCREDMPIFGLCPAHDDFYLVMCSHCNQVVKPQAFQSHYERRHSSSNKTPLTASSSSMYSFFSSLSKSKGNSSAGVSSRACGGGVLGAPSSNSRLLKPPKDKPQLSGNSRPMQPMQHGRIPHDKILTPSIKVEKIPPKMDGALLKTALGSAGSAALSSSIKTGLNCPSIPKPPLPSPGQILNGQGLLPTPPILEKKPEDNSNNRKFLHKRLSEREFDPDIYCGVIDVETKKPCTRSLTCKTHSLTQRRAVQGRRKRFDVLLAEHKNKTREKELLRHCELPPPPPPPPLPLLREPQASPSRSLPEPPHSSLGGTPAEPRPLVSSKPRPHQPSLPRPPGCPSLPSGNAPSDSPAANESPHPPLPSTEPASRGSSDEGEGDEKEESVEKLDCHYSAHHPQPASFCTFGSRQIGRGYFVFDKRWNHIRCALNLMVDKHLNSQMWKKIPPAPGHSVSARVPQRTNPGPLSPYGASPPASAASCTASPSPVLLSPSCLPLNSKAAPAHGTTLNAPPAPGDPRQASSAPLTPAGAALSSVPSPGCGRPPKMKSSKSLKLKEPPANSSFCISPGAGGGGGGCGSSGSGKKRKTSPPLAAHPASSSSPHSMDSLRKNCVANPANCGPAHPSPMASPPTVGLNCLSNRAYAAGVRHDQAGRGPLAASPAESIKRMSVMVNSGDSTLSLGPFVHSPGELVMAASSAHAFPHAHHPPPPLDKLLGKKRKGSPGGAAVQHSGQAGKVAKLPPVNSVKHPGPLPAPPGLASSALLHQVREDPVSWGKACRAASWAPWAASSGWF